jgi:carbonic anhydrase/acetyltransferase-like protein (isoleucine patch superfamily)
MQYRFRDKEPVIGKDTFVSDQSIIIGDVRIGNNCYIGHGSILRGDYGTIVIGSGTAVEEGVVIHAPPEGECRIGQKVTLGHGAIIHSSDIGDLSVIGMGAVISILAQVGKETIVAEGSVVKMRQIIPSEVVAGGNPARILRKINTDDKKFWNDAKQVYIDLATEYLKNGMKKLDY